jgi:hypothetical protein
MSQLLIVVFCYIATAEIFLLHHSFGYHFLLSHSCSYHFLFYVTDADCCFLLHHSCRDLCCYITSVEIVFCCRHCFGNCCLLCCSCCYCFLLSLSCSYHFSLCCSCSYCFSLHCSFGYCCLLSHSCRNHFCYITVYHVSCVLAVTSLNKR